MSEKADSILTNTRFGPDAASNPYANMIGNIAKPAIIAIKVSNPATVSEVLNIFSLSGI